MNAVWVSAVTGVILAAVAVLDFFFRVMRHGAGEDSEALRGARQGIDTTASSRAAVDRAILTTTTSPTPQAALRTPSASENAPDGCFVQALGYVAILAFELAGTGGIGFLIGVAVSLVTNALGIDTGDRVGQTIRGIGFAVLLGCGLVGVGAGFLIYLFSPGEQRSDEKSHAQNHPGRYS